MNVTATLAALTLAELRPLAAQAGIAGRSRMRKAELVAALVAVRRGEATLARLVTDRQAAGEPSLSFPEGSPIRAAIAARNAYLEVRDRCGQENGGPAVSIAWEDYLDACVAAGVCAQTYCWEPETDGDGRCGRHSHGAPLGEDVVSRETTPAAELRAEVTSVRGGNSPIAQPFATLAEVKRYARVEMRGVTSFWQILVTDASGTRVARGYRSGYNATGKSWIWESVN